MNGRTIISKKKRMDGPRPNHRRYDDSLIHHSWSKWSPWFRPKWQSQQSLRNCYSLSHPPAARPTRVPCRCSDGQTRGSLLPVRRSPGPASRSPLSRATMDGGREQQAPPEAQPGKNLIKIPSYQEVFGTGAASSSSKPASYNPPLASSGAAAAASSSSSSSGSFSQAFSFLKSSEFYSPPPPPPQPTTTTPRYLILSSLSSSSQYPRRRRPRLWRVGVGFPGAGRLRLAPQRRRPRARTPFSSVIGRYWGVISSTMTLLTSCFEVPVPLLYSKFRVFCSFLFGREGTLCWSTSGMLGGRSQKSCRTMCLGNRHVPCTWGEHFLRLIVSSFWIGLV